MGLFDALFGRSKPVRSQTEKLFAIATARVTLETQLGMAAGANAGVVFRPLQSSTFEDATRELDELLALSARESGSQIRRQRDEFGFEWVLVHDEQFEDLVATIHMVTLTLAERGFRDQLLAAAFRFDKDGRPLYWLYNYKRGAFYPFAPAGPQRRDNAAELRYGAVMERELPIEKQTDQWYPIWGIPF
ncbi:MAG: hypothetical protein U0531_03045 [Dehalococcoidia bacterium]